LLARPVLVDHDGFHADAPPQRAAHLRGRGAVADDETADMIGVYKSLCDGADVAGGNHGLVEHLAV